MRPLPCVECSKQALENGVWTVETGTLFLEAFADISKQGKPITARSLVESEVGNHAAV
jgi:hypothetical protein